MQALYIQQGPPPSRHGRPLKDSYRNCLLPGLMQQTRAMLRITARTPCKTAAHLQMKTVWLCFYPLYLRVLWTSASLRVVKASMPHHQITYPKQQFLNYISFCAADTQIAVDPEGISKMFADNISLATAQRLQKSHVNFYWNAPGSFQPGTYLR